MNPTLVRTKEMQQRNVMSEQKPRKGNGITSKKGHNFLGVFWQFDENIVTYHRLDI
jgi:hypothetical protein